MLLAANSNFVTNRIVTSYVLEAVTITAFAWPRVSGNEVNCTFGRNGRGEAFHACSFWAHLSLNVVAKRPRMVCPFNAGGFDDVTILDQQQSADTFLPEQNYRCAEKGRIRSYSHCLDLFPLLGIRQTIT